MGRAGDSGGGSENGCFPLIKGFHMSLTRGARVTIPDGSSVAWTAARLADCLTRRQDSLVTETPLVRYLRPGSTSGNASREDQSVGG